MLTINVPTAQDPLYKRYDFRSTVNTGAATQVKLATDTITGRQCAVKMAVKKPEMLAMFKQEVEILCQLAHPNVVRILAAWENTEHCFLVLELLIGGELFERLKGRDGQMHNEKLVAKYVREILEALAYCHQLKIAHRDIKPENLVFESKEPDARMKLIDFGTALQVDDDTVVKDLVGSPYYIAPEVLRADAVRTGRTWRAADVWSVGAVIFLLVTGRPPFPGRGTKEIFMKIRTGKFTFPADVALSEGVRDLITRMLVMDPTKRLSAVDALRHPWVRGLAPESPLPDSVVQQLTTFNVHCKLRRAVGRVLAELMSEHDRAQLAQLFTQFDKNHDGTLGPDEVAAMMREIGHGGSQEARRLLASMDDDKSGTISPEEFAAGVAAGRASESMNEIEATFDIFDLDHDGVVTHAEVEELCGSFLSADGVRAIIAEVDVNKDGRITFDEWVRAMQDTGTKGLRPVGRTRTVAPMLTPITGSPASTKRPLPH